MSSKKQIDDRFNKFGRVSFTAITKVNDFVDHLEAGSVTGTRCKDCGSTFFPPRADCHQCLTSNMEWFNVSGSGTLVTFSRLQYAPTGFEEDLPYYIAVVEFGDYKVFGRISKDVSEDEINVGIPLKAVADKLPNGRLTYVFEKA